MYLYMLIDPGFIENGTLGVNFAIDRFLHMLLSLGMQDGVLAIPSVQQLVFVNNNLAG